jgi:hypothetical protein
MGKRVEGGGYQEILRKYTESSAEAFRTVPTGFASDHKDRDFPEEKIILFRFERNQFRWNADAFLLVIFQRSLMQRDGYSQESVF